jgi:hypothetical protein
MDVLVGAGSLWPSGYPTLMRIKMTCHGKYVGQHVSHLKILYLFFGIKFFIKEISEMN